MGRVVAVERLAVVRLARERAEDEVGDRVERAARRDGQLRREAHGRDEARLAALDGHIHAHAQVAAPGDLPLDVLGLDVVALALAVVAVRAHVPPDGQVEHGEHVLALALDRVDDLAARGALRVLGARPREPLAEVVDADRLDVDEELLEPRAAVAVRLQRLLLDRRREREAARAHVLLERGCGVQLRRAYQAWR